ncbi:MAG: class I SAM-dependent methyltransferase [Acidimicrobiales bacterium]
MAAAGKEIAARTRLRNWVFFRYEFMFTPAQLSVLCQTVTDTKDVPGALVEVGCAFGHTTVFLNRHLDDLGTAKPYHVVDTFSGFEAGDVEFERRQRGHGADDFGAFRVNSRRWFDTTMEVNGIRRVTAHEADAAEFDCAALGPVSWALVDVDLYRPVLASLRGLWAQLAPGGVIVVDDCTGGMFDGAFEAYTTFAGSIGLPSKVVAGKLGLLEKRA